MSFIVLEGANPERSALKVYHPACGAPA